MRTRKQFLLSHLPQSWKVLFLEPFAFGRRNSFRPSREGRVGETVRLKGLDVSGKIIEREGDQYELQLGALRIRADRGDFVLAEESQAHEDALSSKESSPEIVPPSRPSPGMEIDLRGNTVEEGLIELDRYLDSVFLAGLPWVRIIHGKGSGKLRHAVREALRKHPQVTAVESGGAQEGGEGVTIARLES